MELIKLTNKPSKPVKKWKEIEAQVQELKTFFDVRQGNFVGNWQAAYALHHCQVEADSYNFFVLNTQMEGKEKHQFIDRVIINPEIIETPEKIEKDLPKKEFTKDADGKVNIVFRKERQKIANKTAWKEACMSFPHRTDKYIERYFKIKVRYQVKRWYGLKTVTEWMEGLKSHIFQHEFDHALGKNIFYKNEQKV